MTVVSVSRSMQLEPNAAAILSKFMAQVKKITIFDGILKLLTSKNGVRTPNKCQKATKILEKIERKNIGFFYPIFRETCVDKARYQTPP